MFLIKYHAYTVRPSPLLVSVQEFVIWLSVAVYGIYTRESLSWTFAAILLCMTYLTMLSIPCGERMMGRWAQGPRSMAEIRRGHEFVMPAPMG